MTKAEYMKEYYKNNKDKWEINTEEKRIRKRINQKNYVGNHPERNRTREHNWVEKNYEHSIFLQAKRGAKQKGFEFTIEESDIVIPEFCPYLELKLTKTRGKGRMDSNASIDRIDNNKGYIKGNIQIISHLANRMKSNVTIPQLVTFAHGVITMHHS